jgi:hypothetical protein
MFRQPALRSTTFSCGIYKGVFKSNPKNAKSNPNHNPKSTLTTPAMRTLLKRE